MTQREGLIEKIKIVTPDTFESAALEVFRYQAAYNPLYQRFINLLGVNPGAVHTLADVPFLPIRFFKTHNIQTGQWSPVLEFTSSGTTAATTSRHLLRDADWYRRVAREGFERSYGPLHRYAIFALLPSYLERSGSSLVFMADDFIRQSNFPQSGFFLHNSDDMMERIRQCRHKQIPVLLLGVSFALWELAESRPADLSGAIIMETGGMKGRRRELTRDELHDILKKAFQVDAIHAEYGMTELLSQAYSQGDGLFYPGFTMRVSTRDITDPLSEQAFGKTGAINIVDLANIDTISFIATDDLGKAYPDGAFEILGRLDNSDLRGCNLLVFDV